MLVNGLAGTVSLVDGVPRSLLSFTVRDGLVRRIDILADPARLQHLDVAALRVDRPEAPGA